MMMVAWPISGRYLHACTAYQMHESCDLHLRKRRSTSQTTLKDLILSPYHFSSFDVFIVLKNHVGKF